LTKRELIEHGRMLIMRYHINKVRIAQVLGFHRNSLYTRHILEDKDKKLSEAIYAWHKTDDTLGHRSLAALLHTDKKRVLRVMKKYGIIARTIKKKYRYPGKAKDTVHNLLYGKELAQYEVIFSDIFEFRLRDGSKVYCCFIIRAYTRQVLSFSYGYHMKADLVIEALQHTDVMRLPTTIRVIFHSDQGTQYGAEMTLEKLIEYGFTRSMSRAGTPTDNAIAERFVETFKLAVVQRYSYETIGEFAGETERWLNFYNETRPHQSISMLSPNNFAQQNDIETISYLAVNNA
jgi:putative transposase